MQSPTTLRDVHLYGHLAEGVGDTLRLAFDSPAEAIRLLEANFPGFVRRFKEGLYHVSIERNGREVDLDADRLLLGFTGNALHIMPRAFGASRGKGLLTALVGGLIVGTAFFLSGGAMATVLPGIFGFTGATYGTLATMGVGLILQGVGTLLSPTPKPDKRVENNSFIFNGPINVTQQGGVMPVIFGKMMVGTVVLSASLDVEMMTGQGFVNSMDVQLRMDTPSSPLPSVDLDDLITFPEGYTIQSVAINDGPWQPLSGFTTIAGGYKDVTTPVDVAAQYRIHPTQTTNSVIVVWKGGYTNATGYQSILRVRLSNGTDTVDVKVTATFGAFVSAPAANVAYARTNDGAGNFTTIDVTGT